MTLNGNLYTILGKTDNADGFAYTLSLNPQCLIYKAHFPGTPITPGVCILQMMTELLQQHLGQRLTLQSVRNVKFLSILSPSETSTVDYVFSNPIAEGSTIKAKASVTQGTTVFAKMSLTFCIEVPSSELYND